MITGVTETGCGEVTESRLAVDQSLISGRRDWGKGACIAATFETSAVSTVLGASPS